MANEPDIDDILNDLRSALVTAFQRGYRTGQADMRDNILRAAGAPLPEPATPIEAPVHGFNYLNAIRRPTAVEAVRDILTADPGLSRAQILERIPPKMFSPATIGNVLSTSNAFGRLGRRWFVKAGDRLLGSEGLPFIDINGDDDEDPIG